MFAGSRHNTLHFLSIEHDFVDEIEAKMEVRGVEENTLSERRIEVFVVLRPRGPHRGSFGGVQHLE
jgi:hypothetical protein